MQFAKYAADTRKILEKTDQESLENLVRNAFTYLHRLLYVMDANPYQRYSQVAAQHRMSAGIWRFLTAGLILILIQ